jgi:hypothetical protein
LKWYKFLPNVDARPEVGATPKVGGKFDALRDWGKFGAAYFPRGYCFGIFHCSISVNFTELKTKPQNTPKFQNFDLEFLGGNISSRRILRSHIRPSPSLGTNTTHFCATIL